MEIAGILFIVAAIFLITQRWFWLIVFGLSTLACIFTVIASVIHFQILAVVGFWAINLPAIMKGCKLLLKPLSEKSGLPQDVRVLSPE